MIHAPPKTEPFNYSPGPTDTAPNNAGQILDKAKWFRETEYYPHSGQAQIHFDTHRHRVLCNGRRWGKTLLGGKEVEPTAFLTNYLGQPMRGWIVGPQYTDCEKEFRVVYDTFLKLGIDKVSLKFVRNTDSGNMHIITKWGFDVECKSAQHPENLTGEGLDFVLMVEAGRQKVKTWTEYIRPALSDKRGWSLHSGVPEGATEDSLLYKLYTRGQSQLTKRGLPNPWKSWRMPSWTNTVMFPGGRTDPEILDAEEDLTEDEFARQYGAKFVERVGRVIKEWDDDIHLRDLKFTRGWPLYMGIDYGFTNPFVILWIQVDPFNNVHVLREDRWTEKDTTTICEEILEHPLLKLLVPLVVAMYPDPAEPDDTQTMMRLLKKPARQNTGGLLKTRLDLIRRALKVRNKHLPEGHQDRLPGLFVDRRQCVELAWELNTGYRWPEHKSQTKGNNENPMDKDNHAVEALGRFMKGYFSVTDEAHKTKQTRAHINMGDRRNKHDVGQVTRVRRAP